MNLQVGERGGGGIGLKADGDAIERELSATCWEREGTGKLTIFVSQQAHFMFEKLVGHDWCAADFILLLAWPSENL